MNRRSVSARVSGSKLMLKLLPKVSFCPIDSSASVPISRCPPRMGSATCMISFFSASLSVGIPGPAGTSPMR